MMADEGDIVSADFDVRYTVEECEGEDDCVVVRKYFIPSEAEIGNPWNALDRAVEKLHPPSDVAAGVEPVSEVHVRCDCAAGVARALLAIANDKERQG